MIALPLAAMLFFGADPTPQPALAPAIRSTAGVVPALPEIGRVKAVSPACAIMHDLIIPAFAAVRRADDHFALASKAVPAYFGALNDTDVGDDPTDNARFGSDSGRQLAHVDQALSGMLREAQLVDSALKDPRFAASSDDPKIAAEQTELQNVLNAQLARASILSEFAMRQNMTQLKRGLAPVGGRARPSVQSAPRPPTPIVGQPDINGLSNDATASKDWVKTIDSVVHYREYNAANAFIDLAKDCQ